MADGSVGLHCPLEVFICILCFIIRKNLQKYLAEV